MRRDSSGPMLGPQAPTLPDLVLLAAEALPHPAEGAAPREPLAKVLGIMPGMPEAEAARRLARIGQRAGVVEGDRREEDGQGYEHELWTVRDKRYASIRLVLDGRYRVRALQARLRRDGPGLRYAEIGDLGQARRLG